MLIISDYVMIKSRPVHWLEVSDYRLLSYFYSRDVKAECSMYTLIVKVLLDGIIIRVLVLRIEARTTGLLNVEAFFIRISLGIGYLHTEENTYGTHDIALGERWAIAGVAVS